MSPNKAQAGSLYVVVIFVLVVMGFLATSVSRIEWSNSDAHSKDIIGMQASILAYSANEWVLNEIYPPRTSIDEEFDVEAACSAVNDTTKAVPSTVTCQDVAISCGPRGGVLADGSQLFVLTSVAICGVGINQMQRQQDVWLRGQE